MQDNEQQGEHVTVQPGVFQGEVNLRQGLRQSMIYACEQGAKTLIMSDVDYSVWPLSNQQVLAALSSWASSSSNQRQLIMMAATYTLIEEQHNAWKRWRQTWSHRVQCLQIRQEFDPHLPLVFWSECVRLTVRNRETVTGHLSYDTRDIIPARVTLDEQISRCEPAFPVSVTGLW